MNKYLEHLIKDPLVYYIYQTGSFIYQLNNENDNVDYLVIINSNYKVPDEFLQYEYDSKDQIDRKNIKFENCNFIFIYIDNWFNKILNNDIQCWECACLNKKYIIKEYVKLTLNVDIIKLIKNLIKRFNNIKNSSNKEMWCFIKDCLFTQQIINNHKIINFKEANQYYNITQLDESAYSLVLDIWNKFYSKNKGKYEYYIKSIKQNK